MATTSPDGIRTPNPTSPYNLIADWAITASDVQTALNKRANAYVGTSAQRTAFSTAPEGVQWQDTNSNKWTWIRQSGAWVPQNNTRGGLATLPVTSSNVDEFVRINLPAGLYSSPPAVVVTPNATYGQAANWFISVTTVTNGYFDLAYRRLGGSVSALNAFWITTAQV